MSIKPKLTTIEFTYTYESKDSSIPNQDYNVIYNPSKKGENISVQKLNSAQPLITFPIELIFETSDFLKGKDISNKKNDQEKSSFPISLPLIEGDDNEIKVVEDDIDVSFEEESINLSPISSFGTGIEEEDKKEEIDKSNEYMEEIEKGLEDVTTSFESGEELEFDKVTTTNPKPDKTINRPVIRTRITDENNPLQAEKEAAALRGEPKKGKIRRKEEKKEEK